MGAVRQLCLVLLVRLCAGRFDEMNSEDEKIIARRVAEKSFHVNMPRVLRLLIAFGEVLLSHSAILCYFAMVLNTLMSGSVLSLLFPISIFFWAMLSVPRPKKSYWVTIITYTEVGFNSDDTFECLYCYCIAFKSLLCSILLATTGPLLFILTNVLYLFESFDIFVCFISV